MPTISPLLMIVPLLMAAMLCWLARAVNRGNVLAQDFEILNGNPVRRWEAGFDFLMVAVVATFVMFIDEHDVRSIQIFVYGLACLSVLSVALAVLGRRLQVAWTSVILRKIAFRTILCLALFTLVLGMRAAGIGHTELMEDEARLNRHGEIGG